MIEKWVNFKRDYLEISFLREKWVCAISPYHRRYMCVIDWLIDWFDWLIWLIWLIDWLIDWLIFYFLSVWLLCFWEATRTHRFKDSHLWFKWVCGTETNRIIANPWFHFVMLSRRLRTVQVQQASAQFEHLNSCLGPAVDPKPCSLARWTRSSRIQRDNAWRGSAGVNCWNASLHVATR